MDDDLETAALKTQIGALAARWREAAATARAKANDPFLGDGEWYQTGYADAMDRCVQALHALEEQW